MSQKRGDSVDLDNMETRLADFVTGRKRCHLEEPRDVARRASHKLLRRRFDHGSLRPAPAASSPPATGRRCGADLELDSVRQRLQLDSPPRQYEQQQGAQPGRISPETAVSVTPPNASCGFTTGGYLPTDSTPQQRWIWRAAVLRHINAQVAGSHDRRLDLKPFAALDKTSESPCGKPVMTLAAPLLLNDYYTNLLDCSCNDMIALALGSSVYLWNSETQALLGHLEPIPQPGQPSNRQTPSISSLCWSRDGRALCVGTRRGEIQLWDVEHKQMLRCLPPHFSGVRALSWKQQLLSSGCVLGWIHHLDPRAPAPLTGMAVQKEGLCSLQWSPGGEWLASGSTDGLLSIWDSDITGHTSVRGPTTTMKQPSAVKAMGWCPWQTNTIATGGGRTDGELRIWDTESGTCVTHSNTNSQICSLRWTERERYLVTGHGLPWNHITCWTWDFTSLSQAYRLTGHSQRVLHLALNAASTQIFSVGADQRFHIWDV